VINNRKKAADNKLAAKAGSARQARARKQTALVADGAPVQH